MKNALLFLASLVVATTAPTQADDTAPLRHLEFSASTHTTEMYTSASYSGTSTDMATSGTNETITVDVVAVAKDGGLVVHAQAYDKDEHRLEAQHTCAIYGDGRVICPPGDEMSADIPVLLAYLGRGFYDASAGERWERKIETQEGDIVTTFRQVGAPNGDVVHLNAHQEIPSGKSVHAGWASDTDIFYNAKLSVPVSIHDEGHMKARAGANAFTITDFKLLKDSFAN